jgi:DNA-cytosine methyltransferase
MNTLKMEYTKMTNTELKNLCKNRGISGYSSKNKLELIGLLSAQKGENTLEMPSAPSAQVRYIDLFCGLGAFHTAFNSSKDNFKCVLACDIDNGARRIYEANYGLKPEGDIRKIDLATMPDFEILCAGFPCQPFSIAGKQEGFKDEVKGNLFYDILKIIDAKNPPMCILENVKNLETHDNGNTYKTIIAELKKRNYLVTSKVINATEYGSPQARQRIFIIATRDKAFTIPVPTKTTNPVSTIIDKTVEKSDLDLDRYKMVNKPSKKVVPSKPHVIADVFPKLSEEKEKAVKEQNKTYEKTLKSLKEKLKAAEDKLNSTDDAKKDKANIAAVKTVKKEMLGIQAKMKPKGGRQGERVYSTDAVGVTVCASSGGPGAKTGLYKVGNFVRRLTVKETLGMFGFPADYKFPETTSEDSLFYLGNSIVVNIPLAFVPTIAAWFGKA